MPFVNFRGLFQCTYYTTYNIDIIKRYCDSGHVNSVPLILLLEACSRQYFFRMRTSALFTYVNE